MATISRRNNSDGYVFRIQVKFKDKGSGKTYTKSTTYKAESGISVKQAEREQLFMQMFMKTK